jgi:hypothetical protein
MHTTHGLCTDSDAIPPRVARLLALLWIKFNREGDDIAHLGLGEQTRDGKDATHDLSYLCLELSQQPVQ